jgi:hypothetical protein
MASRLLSELTEIERRKGVAYLMESVVSAGTILDFPRLRIVAPWDSRLAFIDPDPLANFGHDCRYILMKLGSAESKSFAARFPPFFAESRSRWSMVHIAPGLPSSMLDASQHQGEEAE